MSGIYVPRKFVQYTCGAGDFSEMATLMLQNEEGVVKHLFARPAFATLSLNDDDDDVAAAEHGPVASLT